jgi:hypothetical protein
MNESLTNPQADLPRVALVISSTRVVLNKGQKDGLKINQRFLIFGLGREILDPDTNQSLGILEEVRGTGKVIHLQERMATVESDMREPTPSITKRRNPFGDVIEEHIPAGVIGFSDLKLGDFAKPVSVAISKA